MPAGAQAEPGGTPAAILDALVDQAVFKVVQDGRIVWANSGAAKLIGCAPPELVGARIQSLIKPRRGDLSLETLGEGELPDTLTIKTDKAPEVPITLSAYRLGGSSEAQE